MLIEENKVQVSFDVKYYDGFAIIGYSIFKNHKSETEIELGQIIKNGIEPYEPGQFYKRELPCLLEAISQIKYEIELIYIDANVWLGDDKIGLGYYLYKALNCKIPIVGICKSRFIEKSNQIIEVFRMNSSRPLFISCIGLKLEKAVEIVNEMYGNYRLPNMIKLADTMSKKTSPNMGLAKVGL